MNARTQITMDPEMQRRAQAKAAELGISFAEYVRRVIDRDLGEAKPKADISIISTLLPRESQRTLRATRTSSSGMQFGRSISERPVSSRSVGAGERGCR